MDTIAIIVTVYTLLGTSIFTANALSARFGLTAVWYGLVYGFALFACYRVLVWFRAYTSGNQP